MKARKTSTSSSRTSGQTRKTAKTAARPRTRARKVRATRAAAAETPETPPPAETAASPSPKPKRAARTKKTAATATQSAAPASVEPAPASPKKRSASTRATSKRTSPATPPTPEPPAPASAEPAPEPKRPRVRRTAAAATTSASGEAPAPKPSTRKPRAPRVPKLPPILFEPDEPAPPPVSGPGEKFALGPTPPESRAELSEPELPEAYGTKRLSLTPCDPHRLYAWWDLTTEQQARFNRASADGHLVLRIFSGAASGSPALEIHLHPESRFWFVRVEEANAPYTAELGYYRRAAGGARRWTRVAVSATAHTPPETISTEAALEFVTLPAEVPLPEIRALAGRPGREARPITALAGELRRSGHPLFQPAAPPGPTPWTPERQRALEELVVQTAGRPTAPGSIEIGERVRPGAERGAPVAGPAVEQPGPLPASPAGALWNVSSPAGGEAPLARGFWLNVNAELIVYGATEPGASVSVGGQPVKLRPDGTFSCRFALPDGQYELPIVATSPDRAETRAALLRFSRATTARGEVGAQPGDPNLKPPTPRNA